MIEAFREAAGGALALWLAGAAVYAAIRLEDRYRATRPTEAQRRRADHHHERGER